MPSNDDLTERQLVRLTRRDRDELRARCRVLGVPPATRVRMLVLEWLADQRVTAQEVETLLKTRLG